MTYPHDDVLRNCRGPNCNYKAPVCTYGYCGACCKKHHNYANMGPAYNTHKPPFLEPIAHGFKIVERNKSWGYTPPEPPKPVVTVCGAFEPVAVVEFPVDDSGNGYHKTI